MFIAGKMNETSGKDVTDGNIALNHSRTIIHIDIDCFYAQVELLNQPHLQHKPVGVKQKNIVVTCNYIARKFGIKKCMLTTEAIKLCPNLLLFNGEDLFKYRQSSNQIHSFLLSFTNKVEKLNLDENYLDVTDMVIERESKSKPVQTIIGHCLGNVDHLCICGCHNRLAIGSQIAYEIRMQLKNDLGFTSCCGISYNKLLAKISCSANKPNQQTTLLPNGTLKFLLNLGEVDKIPGIGGKTKQLLDSIQVRTVKNLQDVEMNKLKKVFNNDETIVHLKNLSLGICNAVVKPSGKPNSIGLEDGFRKISVESDVKEKFGMLLLRLMVLVEEDGRIPMTVKVTVRKYDRERKTGYKETKQCPVPGRLFGHPVGKLSDESTDRLLNIIMGLFRKMVIISKPFHVTLLGLAFSRFHEKIKERSVASFLLKKKKDLSVQSLTSFVSNETFYDTKEVTISSCSECGSDSETEPSPKKAKLDFLIKKRNLNDEDVDLCSPSKLKVENLNLNGDPEFSGKFPSNVDPNVFRELPHDLQQEIIQEWKTHPARARPNCSKQSLILDYCILKN